MIDKNQERQDAFWVYHKARMAYRAREIDDTELLKARKAYYRYLEQLDDQRHDEC